MLPLVFPIYKPLGLTPLQTLDKLRVQYTELEKETLAYAGRLDPMAEGLLLVLRGDACKERDKYQRLPKTYEIEVLFGVSTDTYDTLGLITSFSPEKTPLINDTIVKSLLAPRLGKQIQEYPPFSAAKINGKPLYFWARHGKEVTPPTREVEIYSLDHISTTSRTSQALLTSIEKRIQLVFGDFRQDEILQTWKQYLSTDYTFPCITLIAECSSGTYMRSLAHQLGHALNSSAIAYSIKRTRIGEFRESDALTLS